MATFMKTIHELDENLDDNFDDDFIIIEKPPANGIKIIKCAIPTTHEKYNCSWRFECTRFGCEIRMSAVSEVLDDIDIQKIKIFQMKTIFGNPKMSLSSRNAIKYSIPIVSWYIDIKMKTCFLTPILLIEDQQTIFEISVSRYNYENTPEHLLSLLNKHFEHKFYARDDIGFIESISSNLISHLLKIEYHKNTDFIQKLFN